MMKYLKKLLVTSMLIASFIPTFNVCAAQPIPMRGLDLWLEADYGVTETNGYVTAWESKVNSFGGDMPHILNQAGNEGSTKPILNINANGRKGIHFNMSSLKATVDRYDGEITTFIVSKPKALPTNYPSYLCDVGSMFTTLKKDGTYNVGTSSSGFGGGKATLNSYSVLCTVSQNYGDYKQVYSYQNNVKIQGPFNTNGTNRTGYNAITQYKLGRYSNDEIAAVLVYKGALDSAERTQVYNYLNNKYMSGEESNSFSAAVIDDKIIISANNILTGSISYENFVVTQNNENIDITDAYINEYGNIVIECNDIIDGVAVNVEYSGGGLINLYGDNVEEFEVQSGVVNFQHIDYRDDTYNNWSLEDGDLTTDGYALNFERTDKLVNSNPISGEQTGYAVFKIKNIQESDTLFGDNLYLNSVVLSSDRLSDTNKKIDYIRENKWYVLSYKVKETDGVYKLTLKINGKLLLNNAELDSSFLIDSIGGADFDLKSLYITNYAMSDFDFFAVERELLNNNCVYYSAEINNIDYVTDEATVSATLNYDSPIDESIVLITAVEDSKGRLINAKMDNISGGINKTFTTSIERIDDSHKMAMYIWINGELRPIAEKEIFVIRDIDTVSPTSTQDAESLKTIPSFVSSLPTSYSLNLDEYNNTYVDYLNAKGFLPDGFVYSPNSYMSEETFLAILNSAAGTNLTGNSQRITKKQALLHIYNALGAQYKAYVNKISAGLPNGLTEIEKYAISNALEYGLTNQFEIYLSLNNNLKYSSACELLSKLIIEAEMYERGKGANIPYTLIHSRFANYNGNKIVSESNIESSLEPDNIAFEAMDKACVNLAYVGDYIEFKNVPAADKLSVCYSIPKGSTGFIGLYVNDVKSDTIELSSKPLYRASDSYNYMNYFAEKIVDIKTNAGDNIKLIIEDANGIPVCDGFSSGISINYVKLEEIDEIKSKPQGYISAAEFGAIGDDLYDDTTALQKAIDYAYKTDIGLYIPEGTYYTGKALNIPTSVKISGAGMWYTVIECGDTSEGRAGFEIRGNDITVEDLKVIASDNGPRNGSGGAFKGKGNRVLIKDVWMMNTNTGMWTELYNSVVDSCRITDTVADGIHFPGKAQNNVVKNCIITGCGDDAIGTSSSVNTGIVANNITALNNTVERIYWGRGIMFSGNSESLIDGNVISDVLRNPGVLIWTEANYDTLSAYNIIIRNNVISNCRRNTGLHRGAITIHNNRANSSYWVDADIYDNEVYQDGFSYCTYVADSGNGVVYCESKNNIFLQLSNEYIVSDYIADVESVNAFTNNLLIVY